MKRKLALVLLAAVILAAASEALAHEVRPAYLELKETSPGRYQVAWRTPLYYGRRLPVRLEFPERWNTEGEPKEQVFSDSMVERRVVETGPDGLAGGRIRFAGLEFTITDVLVRVIPLEGSPWTLMARPNRPQVEFKEVRRGFDAARAYLMLGVRHILFGIDHLFFVFGLLLLARGFGPLLKTITAFTVGHSISLALATLGFVNVPSKPLSAAIALSIVFLAAELIRARRGELSFTIRNPWVVSFGFGILHGLGFAGALVALGLPRPAIPLALFLFNVGVEIGQLLFIFVALALIESFRRLELTLPAMARPVPVYAMGSIAAFWFVGRFVAMFY